MRRVFVSMWELAIFIWLRLVLFVFSCLFLQIVWLLVLSCCPFNVEKSDVMCRVNWGVWVLRQCKWRVMGTTLSIKITATLRNALSTQSRVLIGWHWSMSCWFNTSSVEMDFALCFRKWKKETPKFERVLGFEIKLQGETAMLLDPLKVLSPDFLENRMWGLKYVFGVDIYLFLIYQCVVSPFVWRCSLKETCQGMGLNVSVTSARDSL